MVEDVRFGFKVGHIGPKLKKKGSANQNVLKSDLKSPGLVPFGANLTHFGAKSGHTVPGKGPTSPLPLTLMVFQMAWDTAS